MIIDCRWCSNGINKSRYCDHYTCEDCGGTKLIFECENCGEQEPYDGTEKELCDECQEAENDK